MFEMDSTGEWQDESASAGNVGGVVSSAGQVASMASGNPLFAIGSQILGGIFGSSSAKKANKEARKIAAAQMAFQERSQDKSMAYNSAQAAAQREWQTYMSSSSHQREIGDLRAAGLNPILSGTGGMGASTPSGSSASSSAQSGASAPVINEGAAGLASALAIQNAQAQTKLLHAQTEKTHAEARNLEETSGTATLEKSRISMDTMLKLSDANLKEALEVKAKNEGLLVAAQEVQQTLVNEINKSQLPETRKQELRRLTAEASISQSAAVRAKTDEKFYESEIGSIFRTVRLVLEAIGYRGR